MSQSLEEVYPNVIQKKSAPHSNGSFGTVFIVLAVIVVISAIACFLGRLCNRRYNKSTAAKQSHRHEIRPREREGQVKHKERPPNFQNRDLGDIEFGFDRRIPTAKVAANDGDARLPSRYEEGTGDARLPSRNGEGTGDARLPSRNGEGRPEVRFVDRDGKFRPGN